MFTGTIHQEQLGLQPERTLASNQLQECIWALQRWTCNASFLERTTGPELVAVDILDLARGAWWLERYSLGAGLVSYSLLLSIHHCDALSLKQKLTADYDALPLQRVTTRCCWCALAAVSFNYSVSGGSQVL